MKFKFVDEAGAVAHIEQLDSQLLKLTTDLGTANGSVTAITGERDKARTDLAAAQSANATLTTERDAANGRAAALASENATLKEGMADFNKRVAAELAKHGIRAEAANTDTGKAENEKPMTATEKVLKARGVSSLQELSAKAKK